MSNIKFPVKGDIISLKGCFGVGKATKWKVLSKIDNEGWLTLKSLKKGIVKKVLIDIDKHTGGVNPDLNLFWKNKIVFYKTI